MRRIALILVASIAAGGASAQAQPEDEEVDERSDDEDDEDADDAEANEQDEGPRGERDAKLKSETAVEGRPPVRKLAAVSQTSPGVAAAPGRPAKMAAINGYLQPRFGFTYRPQAKPRDKSTYGAGGSRAGVILSGSPAPMWSYRVHFMVGSDLLTAVERVDAVDLDGDGVLDGVDGPRSTLPGVFVEEALIRFEPSPIFRLDVGEMRIPFTLQQQSANTSLLFPQRSGPNEAFLSGTDTGVLASVDGFDERVRASAGVFGGSNVSGVLDGAREEGFLYSARVDAEPLGAFPSRDARPVKGPLRVAVGAGFVYHPSILYDEDGFDVTNMRDMRLSGSLRVAGGGFYAQAEVLRRDQSDDLTSRREVSTGAYVQAAFLTPFHGIAPIGRLGWTEEDQRTDPRTTYWAEGGIAIYLRPNDPDPNALRLVIQYTGEFRHTEEEDAHGVVSQLQMRF